MLLQERIEELGSGIIEVNGTEVKLTGFTCEERLKDFYEKNRNCCFSKGIYILNENEELDYSKLQDNALFLIIKDGEEVSRYQFEPLFIIKGEDKFKYTIINSENKKEQKSKAFTIRKCKYTGKYNYTDMKESLLFDSFEELNEYIFNNYNGDLKKMFFVHHYVENNLYVYKDFEIKQKYFYNMKELMEFVYERFGRTLTSADIIRDKAFAKNVINKVLAIDFETPNGRNKSICSIGIALSENKEIVFNKEFLVNPEDEFWDKNTEINGISEKDVEDKPSFPEVWDKIKGLIDKHTLVIAHNASFDMNVLIKACNNYGIKLGSFNYLCTCKAAGNFFADLGDRPALNKVAEYLNIEFKHHKADEDALVCLEAFNHMTKDLETLTISAIEEKLKTEVEDIKGKKKTASITETKDSAEKERLNSIFKKKVNIKNIKPETTNIDPNNPVYGFTFVFTGDLNKFADGKHEAMQKVVNLGGKLGNSITKTTDYLVCGETDLKATRGKEKSSKLIKAEEYIEKGISIKIIDEDELIELLNCKYEEISLDLDFGIEEFKPSKTIEPIDGTWAEFKSEEDKVHRLKNFKLLSPKAVSVDKKFYYKGAYVEDAVLCDIVGFKYCDNDILVIKIGDSLHSIRGEYLKQMQDKNFNKFKFE